MKGRDRGGRKMMIGKMRGGEEREESERGKEGEKRGVRINTPTDSKTAKKPIEAPWMKMTVVEGWKATPLVLLLVLAITMTRQCLLLSHLKRAQDLCASNHFAFLTLREGRKESWKGERQNRGYCHFPLLSLFLHPLLPHYPSHSPLPSLHPSLSLSPSPSPSH